MLSTHTEKLALDLIEDELKRSAHAENIVIMIEKFKDVKFMFNQLCNLNVYCSLNPQDADAKEKLYIAYDNLGRELSQLTWKVFNKDTPHPFVNS